MFDVLHARPGAIQAPAFSQLAGPLIESAALHFHPNRFGTGPAAVRWKRLRGADLLLLFLSRSGVPAWFPSPTGVETRQPDDSARSGAVPEAGCPGYGRIPA